jgi:hypothetical protein
MARSTTNLIEVIKLGGKVEDKEKMTEKKLFCVCSIIDVEIYYYYY